MAKNESAAPPGYTTVSIYDQTYHLTGQNPAHIRRLAALVDSKMRAVAAQGRTVDSLRVAVLAALNLADELAQTAGADMRRATHAPLRCAGCWMKCLKRSARPGRKWCGSVFEAPNFCSRLRTAIPNQEGRKRTTPCATPHKTCNSSPVPLLSAIETGLQSRWVVNAG